MPRTASRRDERRREEDDDDGHDDDGAVSDGRRSDGGNDDDDDDEKENSDAVRVCQGLTDGERREIRKRQRQLHSEIEEGGDAIEIDDARGRNNALFRKVRYTREAVLDGENLNLIASRAAQRVDQLIQAPRYDADRVVKKLIEKCRCVTGDTSYFDWRLLGAEAGACFNAVPANVAFLNGPLTDGQDELHVRQRAVRQKRMRNDADDAEEEKPEDVKGHTHRSEDNLSAVQENIQAVGDALNAKVDRSYRARKAQLAEAYGGHEHIPEKALKRLKKNPDQCAVELLFNPKSFTQTVENLFHYSFLVKKGTAALAVRDGDKELDPQAGILLRGGPVAKYVRPKEVTPEPRQAIVSLTLEDFRDLVEAYGVERSDVPHRAGSKHERLTGTRAAAATAGDAADGGSDDDEED